MQTRPALLLVLVLALLATGCANRPNLSSGITTETVLSLPPDLEVPAGDTALLYPLSASPEGAKAQVEALVGQPLGEGEPGVSGTLYSLGQATVTIDQDTGYWTYETGQDIFSVDPSALPPPLSDAQAQAIALDYLQTHGLWSGPMASVGVGPITSGETGGDTILGKNVYCFPAVDGAPVEGVFRIVVTLDPTGKVVTVHHLAAQPGQPREVPRNPGPSWHRIWPGGTTLPTSTKPSPTRWWSPAPSGSTPTPPRWRGRPTSTPSTSSPAMGPCRMGPPSGLRSSWTPKPNAFFGFLPVLRPRRGCLPRRGPLLFSKIFSPALSFSPASPLYWVERAIPPLRKINY